MVIWPLPHHTVHGGTVVTPWNSDYCTSIVIEHRPYNSSKIYIQLTVHATMIAKNTHIHIRSQLPIFFSCHNFMRIWRASFFWQHRVNAIKPKMECVFSLLYIYLHVHHLIQHRRCFDFAMYQFHPFYSLIFNSIVISILLPNTHTRTRAHQFGLFLSNFFLSRFSFLAFWSFLSALLVFLALI